MRLDRAIGTTTPDVIYHGDHHEADEGVCIYLDGLSGHLHGNPETIEKDREIRTWLRNTGYDVIEIPYSDLFDRGAMTNHMRRLAGHLREDEVRAYVRESPAWYDAAQGMDEEAAK